MILLLTNLACEQSFTLSLHSALARPIVFLLDPEQSYMYQRANECLASESQSLRTTELNTVLQRVELTVPLGSIGTATMPPELI